MVVGAAVVLGTVVVVELRLACWPAVETAAAVGMVAAAVGVVVVADAGVPNPPPKEQEHNLF